MADWTPSGDELTLAEELWLQEVAALDAGTNQILGRDSGDSAYEWKTIAAGANVIITHTAGQIEIDASGVNSLSALNDVNIDSVNDNDVLQYDVTSSKWINTTLTSVSTSGSPVDNDFARFTDANTIEGRSYSEVLSDLSLSSNLQNLTDAEVGELDNIGTVTITNTQWGYLGSMSGQPLENITGESVGSLSDIDITAAAAGELLIHNATSGNWEDASLTGGEGITITNADASITIGTDGVLEDLDTLGAASSDGEIIVATGAGTFAYESGATARTSLGLGTGDSPQFTGIELGNASDTTLARVSAGDVNIEGNIIYRAGGTDVALADGGTGIDSSGATDGQLLIGGTASNDLQLSTLTAGAGIDVTNGTNSVTVAAETASAANSGVVELATSSETTTGTDTGRAITPDGLAGSDFGIRYIEVLVEAGDTDLTSGDSLNGNFISIPAGLDGYDLIEVGAEVFTAGVTGNTDVQVNNHTDSVDMLSTVMRIETGETSTTTSAQSGTIDTANDDVSEGDVLTVDVDSVQSGTAPKGLIVRLGFKST